MVLLNLIAAIAAHCNFFLSTDKIERDAPCPGISEHLLLGDQWFRNFAFFSITGILSFKLKKCFKFNFHNGVVGVLIIDIYFNYDWPASFNAIKIRFHLLHPIVLHNVEINYVSSWDWQLSWFCWKRSGLLIFGFWAPTTFGKLYCVSLPFVKSIIVNERMPIYILKVKTEAKCFPFPISKFQINDIIIISLNTAHLMQTPAKLHVETIYL